MDLHVFDLQGKSVGQVSLDPSVWDGHVNLRLLSQALDMYRTNLRTTQASTKTRAHVSGGGKKPFKQKHTGRARAGSTRSPLWRHGGSVFGPRPRDVSYRLPQMIRRQALLESLKGKLKDAELVIVDQFAAASPKTKPFAGLAKTFNIQKNSVIVLHQPTEHILKSLRNLARFELRQASNLNAWDVMNADKVVVTQAAFEQLEQRVRGTDNGHASSN